MPSDHPYRRRIYSVLIIAFIIVANGCDIRPTSMGYQHRIVILADSIFWNEIKNDVLPAFETIVYTPHVEKRFYIKRIGLNELNDYKSRMNVFLIGTTTGQSEVDKYLRNQIPAEFIDGVNNGKYFYLFKNDLFVRDQLGLIMMAKNTPQFIENFEILKNEIYDKFESAYFDRLSKSIYDSGEQEDLEEFLVNRFGWKVRIQHDYFIANHDMDDRYVWLRRIDPDRWLSIWEMEGDSSLLRERKLFDIRDTITKKYYSGDYVVREDSYVITSDFQGKPTTKIIGLWRNDSNNDLVGGPFRTYIVHDKEKSRFYFIDYAVQAIGKLKQPYLDQLEIMARTFEVVSSDRKTE